MFYAARYPDQVRRMVLVGPMPPRPRSLPRAVRRRRRRRGSAAPRPRVKRSSTASRRSPGTLTRRAAKPNRIFLRGVAATPAAADRIKGDLCAATPTNLRLMGVMHGQVWTSIWKLLTDEFGYDWRPIAARVTAPTLVVHGDQDPLPLAASEEWVRALPAARLLVIPCAGHYPHAEQPQQFFPPVERFLDSR